MNTRKIRLSKSCIGTKEQEAVRKVLEHEYLGMGGEVWQFEEALKTYIGTDGEVICVNTGTSALHLAVMCMGIGPGDEVLVPTLTYVACYQAISATGATPIACEVIASTGFLDLDDAERRITPRTRAIMPVHYASNSREMADVYKLAQAHKLRIIEDAAHSFGCLRDRKMIGAEGDVICFSFDGIKNITCGEGGAIVTRDLELARRIKDARLLGVENDTQKRYSGDRSWEFDVTHQGFRYHMGNIMAAIGMVQLERFEEFATKRKQLAKTYVERLASLNSVQLFDFEYEDTVPHIFPVKIADLDRQAIMSAAQEADIEFGLHYALNHQLTRYKTDYALPVAEALYASLLTLPLHPDITTSDQDRVVELLKVYCH